MHVYRWLNAARAKADAEDTLLDSLPVLKTKKKWTKKIHPGTAGHVSSHTKRVAADGTIL